MKASSGKTVIVVTAALTLAAARAGLPALLTWLANVAARKIPGVRGTVRRVQINFMAPGLTVKDFSLTTLNGGAPEHWFQIEAITLNSEWKALLTGALVGSLRVIAPRLLFNAADGIRSVNGSKGRPEQQREKAGRPWQDKVMQLPRFKLSSAVLTEGEIHVAGIPGEKGAVVSIDRLNLRAENITNSSDLAPTLLAKLTTDARVLASGKFQLKAQGYPLAKLPTFNADLTSSDIDLSALRNIIEKAVGVDVRSVAAGSAASTRDTAVTRWRQQPFQATQKTAIRSKPGSASQLAAVGGLIIIGNIGGCRLE